MRERSKELARPPPAQSIYLCRLRLHSSALTFSLLPQAPHAPVCEAIRPAFLPFPYFSPCSLFPVPHNQNNETSLSLAPSNHPSIHPSTVSFSLGLGLTGGKLRDNWIKEPMGRWRFEGLDEGREGGKGGKQIRTNTDSSCSLQKFLQPPRKEKEGMGRRRD